MLPLPLSHLLRPDLLALGRLPARANLTACPDAKALQHNGSYWRKGLDGTWRFQLVSRPDAAPPDWMTDAARDAPWRDIQVPGVWTRQATGDLPHYTNWRMPFACDRPPDVPTENPTGLYRTDFDLPKDWSDRHTVLHLGGFESLVLVWCNGRFVGMGKDSRLPSEFDLGAAVQPGTNQLAVMVVRWCDATWIEDQDHWNHGGLHRSVFVEARGQTHIRDIVVDTDYDAETRVAQASVRVEVEGPSDTHRVRLVLEDADGEIRHRSAERSIDQFDTTQPDAAQWAQSFAFKGYAADFEMSVPAASPWSAEVPTRYRLVTELLDAKGKVCEAHETWIGFTRIETGGRRLRVNGRPVVLIGVNRHDHHPENGKTCSAEDIRAELVMMKRHNINAIRTAHYPNDPVLLDLADELGFYVIDEANVECHARWSQVAHHPGYFSAIMDRILRMIARDRNHPCIIGWSLGNEAGLGPVHRAAATTVRQIDPGRFVHYEGAVSARFSFPFARSPETTQKAAPEAELAASDVLCPMYTSSDDVADWAIWAEATGRDDRPLILCEFSHAMGNSNGSIADYVDAFYAQAALAGGFVWDWRDQGLAEIDAQGQAYWAYGGHFGDEPNDANFCINGLVGPDGVPHPALREYMWAARPVTASLDEDGQLIVTNRRVFTDTSDLELHWVLLRDGVRVEDGRLKPNVPPGQAIRLDPFLRADLDPRSEWHLTITWMLRKRTDWADAGYILAWDQLVLNAPEPSDPAPFALSTSHAPPFQSQSVTHGGMGIRFDADGAIQSILADRVPILAAPITACVWRAPTDNDGGKPGARALFANRTADWVGYGLNDLRSGSTTLKTFSSPEGLVQAVERSWQGRGAASLTHRTQIQFAEGALIFDETLIVPEPWQDIPRIGVRFEVDAAYDQMEWLGLGPDESYPDRKGAQTFGVWTATVAEQYHPYVRPQEHGAHQQTHWVRLCNANGKGLEILLSKPLSVTVRPHHDVDLNAAETLAQLQTRGTSEVHLDAAIRGLGTAACGPDTRPKFRVGPGTYKFRWTLRLIDGET